MPSKFHFSQFLEPKHSCCLALYGGEMVILKIISAPEWVSGWKWTCSHTTPPLKINVLHSCRTQWMLPIKEVMAPTGSCLCPKHLGKVRRREMSACWLLLLAFLLCCPLLCSSGDSYWTLPSRETPAFCLLPSAVCRGMPLCVAEAEAMQLGEACSCSREPWLIWTNSL